MLIDKPTAPLSIGIEPQSKGLRFVALRKNKITGGTDVKQLYKSDEDPLFVTMLPASEVLLRVLEVPLKKEKDINETLAFQAEPLLPYPIDEALLEKLILEKTETGTRLCLLAAKEESVREHLAGLEVAPEVVTSIPAALAAFSTKYFRQDSPFIIVHLGADEITCIAMEKNRPIAAQACKTSLDLKRTLFSISQKFNASFILATGEGSQDPERMKQLETAAEMRVERHLYSADAAAIGAALSALEGESVPAINFLKGNLANPEPFKRFYKPVLLCIALSFFAAIAFFLYGKAKLGYEEDRIRQEYIALLADQGKSFSDFEKELGIQDEEQPDPSRLSIQEIDRRVAFLESKQGSAPNLFPLQPDTPLVSDLLAWLSTHPVVVKGDGLVLESLSYVMVKRPDQTKKGEKYQVKVELEFSSPSSTQAREFHDALVAPNDFVDPKGEIKWSSSRGHSKTSFFLKDKTKYRSR